MLFIVLASQPLFKIVKLMKKITGAFLFLILLYGSFTISPYKAQADACTTSGITSGWENWSGGVRYCVRGFETQDDLYDHMFWIRCNENCSSNWAADWWGQLFAGQRIDIEKDLGGAQDDDGRWYSCFAGYGFSDDVKNVFNRCMNPLLIEKTLGNKACGAAFVLGAGAGAITVGTGGAAGPALVPLAGTVGKACIAAIGITEAGRIFTQSAEACLPQFSVQVRKKQIVDVTICEDPMIYNTELTAVELTESWEPFSLCSQLPEGSEAYANCIKCTDPSGTDAQEGVWTAVGCIKREPESILSELLSIGLTTGGGIALIMILGAGFIFSTSAGDPKRVDQAKELIASAIIGLIFIIFSIAILQFIGFTVLKIPGFGG